MRAVVVHLKYDVFGGAENFSFRIIEILQRRFEEVVVLHLGVSPLFSKIEALTGIVLNPQRVRFQSVSIFMEPRVFVKLLPALELFRLCFIRLMAGRFVRDDDLVVSTFGEFPFRNSRLIQALHIPIFVSDYESLLYCGIVMSRLRRLLQVGYVFLARSFIGLTKKSLAGDLLIVNSNWTAAQFRRHYPCADIRVLHHGVDVSLDEASDAWVPFPHRANNFVLLGRITQAKRVELAIEIIERVRSKGYMVGLIIVGSGTGEYFARVNALAASRPWVTLYSNLARSELEALLVKQKWGIHCYQFEHYGLAPAEMQALGCLTFVHDSGGQREIVLDPKQRYVDSDDAVEKICGVLAAPDLQSSLIASAQKSIEQHRGSHFVRQFEHIVDEMCCIGGS